MAVVDGSFDQPMKLEEHAIMPMAGGVMHQGYQCGMLWGAALAAGAQAYRVLGPGSQAEVEALKTSQRLVETFRERYKQINCGDIIHMSWKSTSSRQVLKFFLRGGPIGCFRMAADYALAAFDEINTPLPATDSEAPSRPQSCTALLARQMGVSNLHAVMAAGLAGGIGLSGGACGALGAAIWIIEMNNAINNEGKVDFNDPLALAAIDRYLESADYEFECEKVVGRKFADVADHAEYLHNGGYAKIIEALGAK
jgi:hypothetical protein